MSELPKGWAKARIADFTNKVGSGSTPRGGSDAYQSTGIPLIRSMNVHMSGFRHDGLAFINEAQARLLDGVEVFGEDVLLNITGASIGRVTQAPPEMEGARVNQHVCIIRPSSGVEGSYLSRFLASPEQQALIIDTESGVTRQALTKEKILSMEVPIPPLPEQRRIVAKIEALMARSRKAREALAEIPDLSKRYRQGLIRSAVTGELTADWRLDRQHEPWKAVTVGDLIQGKPRNGYSPVAVDFETPVKSLSLSATTSGCFKPEFFKYINEDIPEDSHLWLEAGDVLVQRANTIELVGVSAIYNGPSKTYIYPDLMMKCRPNSKVLATYLHLVLSSEPVRTFFREKATGTAGNMPKINQQTVISAPAFLPSIEEQREIVRRVGILISHVDQSVSCLTVARNEIDSLDQSILAKAFCGELVPQDPADEPAEVLLARIRAAREAAGAPARRARTLKSAVIAPSPAPRAKAAETPTLRRSQPVRVAPSPVVEPKADPRHPPSIVDPLDAAVLRAFRQALSAQAHWNSDDDLLSAVAQILGFARLSPPIKTHLRQTLALCQRHPNGTLTLPE